MVFEKTENVEKKKDVLVFIQVMVNAKNNRSVFKCSFLCWKWPEKFVVDHVGLDFKFYPKFFCTIALMPSFNL